MLQKTRHISGATIFKIINVDVILRLPALTFDAQGCCSNYPIGKQIKSLHKSTTHHTTSRTLDFLHIDLIGPIQTESLGGKRYATVFVDDFSRYTWIRFIRDKLKLSKSVGPYAYNFNEKRTVTSYVYKVIMVGSLKI